MIDINDKYNVADKQRTLLRMLMDFHEFCVENGIAYSIIGGTLLGAIREKGFIPWDDDVDIVMNRSNFEKLKASISRFQGYYLRENLWVYKIVEEDVYHRDGIKDDTPVLDIFIADRIPSGVLRRRIKLLGLKVLQGMMKTEKSTKKDFQIQYKVALFFTGVMGKLFSTEEKQRMYTMVSIWRNEEAEQPMMICNDIFQSLGCEYDYQFLDDYIMLGFEDTFLMATKRWENYLRVQYGDYMRPVRTEH